MKGVINEDHIWEWEFGRGEVSFEQTRLGEGIRYFMKVTFELALKDRCDLAVRQGFSILALLTFGTSYSLLWELSYILKDVWKPPWLLPIAGQ